MPGSSQSAAESAAGGANCIRCGRVFSCNPAGACWCKERPLRPMPPDATGCFCPSCFELTDTGRPGAADAAAL